MLVPRRFAVAIGIGGWRQIVKPSIIIGCAIVLAVALDNSQSLAVSGTWSSTAATGTWSKPHTSDLTNYFDTSGAPMAFLPGPTWIILAPPGTHVSTGGA